MNNSCKNILIFESDETHLEHIEETVKNLEHDVISLADSTNCLKHIEECKPDIVILDTKLPGANTFELLEMLQGRDDLSDIMVMLIAENPKPEMVLKGLELGVCDFIRKPYNAVELSMKIQNLIKFKEHEHEIERLYEELQLEKTRIENERNLLSKYFSKDLIQGILNGSISTELGGEITIASILFCDLRNSTLMAEQIAPDIFSKFLSNLFTDITDIIYGENGSVNKFIGDGILATFGIPQPIEDDAYHCATVAVKIRKYLASFNQFLPKYLKEPVSIGIGIARGKLFTGNIGSVNQIEYTVLGDPVNIASRLEVLTKRANVDILMDGNIRNELGERIKVKKAKRTALKGKHTEVDIYYLESL